MPIIRPRRYEIEGTSIASLELAPLRVWDTGWHPFKKSSIGSDKEDDWGKLRIFLKFNSWRLQRDSYRYSVDGRQVVLDAKADCLASMS